MAVADDIDNDGSDDVTLGGFTLGTRTWDFEVCVPVDPEDPEGPCEDVTVTKTGPDLKYLKSVFRGGDLDGDGVMNLVGSDSLLESTLANADTSVELDLIFLGKMLEEMPNIGKYIWVE